MKELQLRATSIATPNVAHDIALTQEEQDQLKNGSPGLSPERITAAATTMTAVMNEILQRDTRLRSFREGGINE